MNPFATKFIDFVDKVDEKLITKAIDFYSGKKVNWTWIRPEAVSSKSSQVSINSVQSKFVGDILKKKKKNCLPYVLAYLYT